MTPYLVGPAGLGHGTPSSYLLIARDDQPESRVDLFRSDEELHVHTAAAELGGRVIIGFGHALYFLEPSSHQTQIHRLGSYFCGFYPAGEGLLVAYCDGLLSFRQDGTVAWQNSVLAVDGVQVTEIKDGIVTGLAEWDPPGGWQPFRVDLASGRVLSGAA